MKQVCFVGASVVGLLSLTSLASAQPSLPSEPIPTNGEVQIGQPSFPVPDPSESPPPLPDIPPAPPPDPNLQTPSLQPSTPPALTNPQFQVNQIEVVGNTVLFDEIEQLVQDYENRSVTFEELLELRSKITQLYIEKGYITSGAFLPNNQDLSDGEIQIQVVEGAMEAIEICMLSPNAGRDEEGVNTDEGNQLDESELDEGELDENELDESELNENERIENERIENEATVEQTVTPARCGSAHLRESYVRSRLARATQTPVSQPRLEEALQLLQLNPLIQQVNAELTAGSAPGFNILQVQVREASAFRVNIGTNNYQSPSIGSEQVSIAIGYDNVLGFGDRISAQYGITEGLDSYGAGYAFPVNAMDGTLEVRYSQDNSNIIESDFEELGIRSDSETWSFGFRQPLIRTPEDEFALGINLDLRQSQSYILDDEPFSFSEGTEDGEAKVTVVRLIQDWVDRSPTRVLAARSQFSLGVNAFDATINDLGTDGEFFAWLGQFQYVQQLNRRGLLLLARIDTQLTPDSLLPLEQFAIGGAGTVRGYRQNQIVTDSGVLAGLEVRIPLLDNPQRLQLVPFFDIGHGWNNQLPDPELDTIASLGLGVRWLIIPNLSLQVDYGVPIIEVENRGDSLQEDGLSFSIQYQPF